MKQFGWIALLVFSVLINSSVIFADPRGWSDDQIIGSNVASFFGGFTSKTDQRGDLHLVWVDYRNNYTELYYKKLDNLGKNRTSDIRLTFFPPNYEPDIDLPSLDIDREGNVHIIWTDDRNIVFPTSGHQIFYKKLDNNGLNLTSDILVGGGNLSYFPSVKVDTEGDVHIMWNQGTSANGCCRDEIFYKRLNNNGINLTSEIRVTFTNVTASFAPAFTIDSQGDIHFVWIYYDGTIPKEELYYKKIDNSGRSLVEETPLTVNHQQYTGVYNNPAIARDQDDNIHVIWPDRTEGSTAEIYYKKLNQNGVNLTDNIRLTYDSRLARYPSVSVDQSNDVHIAWETTDYNETNFEIFYAKLNNNGELIVPSSRLTFAQGYSVYPSLSIDINRITHIIWLDNRGGNVDHYYKRSLPPQIMINGSPIVGTVLNITISDPLNPNVPYVLGMSLGTAGIPLGDGRMIPLAPDSVLYQSIINATSLGLFNARGRLNTEGRAVAQFRIPSVLEIIGTTLYFSVITLNPTTVLPQAVTSIAPATNVTLH